MKARRKIKTKKVKVLPKKGKKVKLKDSSELEFVRLPYIRFIGVGGGAGSILDEVSKYISKNPKIKSKVEFYCINSDRQALKSLSSRVRKVLIGEKITGGFGTGGDTKLAEQIANQDIKKIEQVIDNRDFFVVVSCLGGGFSSGALPVLLKNIKEKKKKSIGIFTMPFAFEGQKRMTVAKKALNEAKDFVNAFTPIYNEKIFDFIDKNTPLTMAFSMINRKLAENLEGFLEMIYLPGLINIDFADLNTTVSGTGQLFYLYSIVFDDMASLEKFSESSFFVKINKYSLQSHEKFVPEKILFNITADESLKLYDVSSISNIIIRENPRAKVIFGISYNKKMKSKVRLTIILVGRLKEVLNQAEKKKVEIISQNSGENLDTAKNKKESNGASKIEKVEKTNSKKQVDQKVKRKKAKNKKNQDKKTAKKVKVKKNKVGDKKEIKNKTASIKRTSKKDLFQKPEAKINKSIIQKKRRTPLDVKEIRELENKTIEEQENKWDIPAFLLNNEVKKDDK